ncbi:hypothetical protein Celaphus_00013485 [Cervus elaphus hippelaphus]|uniref:Uncharacterized protein n=1 Tax=Cervus elaphus hippelaphus TaxID=46360 RepID=A0A212DGG4_CEREH|nr:hypothetical protein Celaphus_00013485 [Cervus elaphus hippelaphus]
MNITQLPKCKRPRYLCVRCHWTVNQGDFTDLYMELLSETGCPRSPGEHIQDTFINVFSSRSQTFLGGGGRKSLLGLRITWSLPPGKIRTQTEADRPFESASNGKFSTHGPRLRSRADSRSSHSPSDADAGRLRTDPGRRGRGLGSDRCEPRDALGAARLDPGLLKSSRRPPRDGPCGTPGHLSAPSRSTPWRIPPTRWPKPWRPGLSLPGNATLGPKKPMLRRDDPSRLAGGSAKPSRQHP